jgi:glycerophosphoryl diester phosphodiesterase
MTSAPEQRTLRLAHRGDWRREPENTIPALLAAFDVPGCDGLEFDVRVSADGVPVLLHDLSLARVQGVPAMVGALTAAELAGHAVPALADALAAIDRRRPGAFLDVELKGTDHGPATATVLRAARGDHATDAVVSSFEASTLAAMRDLLPGWGRWLNTDDLSAGTIRRALDLGCSGVSVQFRALDRASIDAARAAGLDVAGWTIRSRTEAERVCALGVVAICVEDEALDDR